VRGRELRGRGFGGARLESSDFTFQISNFRRRIGDRSSQIGDRIGEIGVRRSGFGDPGWGDGSGDRWRRVCGSAVRRYGSLPSALSSPLRASPCRTWGRAVRPSWRCAFRRTCAIGGWGTWTRLPISTTGCCSNRVFRQRPKCHHMRHHRRPQGVATSGKAERAEDRKPIRCNSLQHLAI